MPGHNRVTVSRELGLGAGLLLLTLLAGCAAPATRDGASDQRALLVGPLWVAEDVGGQPVAANTRMTLTFYADRRLVGKAACNTYSGRYRLDGAALGIAELKGGKSDCTADLAAAEQGYLAALAAVARYEVRPGPLDPGGVLFLIGADGRTLRFHRDTTENVQLLDYQCDDGSALRVIFDWHQGTASVSTNGASAATLRKATALSGFRFENATQSFAGEGGAAAWSAGGGTPVACQVSN